MEKYHRYPKDNSAVTLSISKIDAIPIKDFSSCFDIIRSGFSELSQKRNHLVKKETIQMFIFIVNIYRSY